MAALDILASDRKQALESEKLLGNRKFLATVKGIKIMELIKPRARNSIAIFNLRQRNLRRVGQLTEQQLNSIRPLIENKIFPILRASLMPGVGDNSLGLFENFYEAKLIDLVRASSKAIREARAIKDPICIYKIGAVMTPLEVENWGNSLKRLSSVRHRNTILRVAHGEVYSKEKLVRFGLINNENCPRCGHREDLRHKIIDCPYVKRIWSSVLGMTGLTLNDPELENRIIGCYRGCTQAKLTLHAEILSRILSLKDNESYLMLPKVFVRNAILYLSKRERKEAIKIELASLLN